MSPHTVSYSRRAALRRGAQLAGGAVVGMAALERAAHPASASAPSTGRLVAAHLDFGFRLYAALARSTGSGANLFISPLSIALALSMVYDGARGGTQTAMGRAMGIGAMQASDLNSASAALIAHLRALDPAIDLSIADSLWLRQGLTVVPAFQQAMRRWYGAPITNLDFADPRSAGVINAWVNTQTHGLIPAIVGRIPPQMILYLINALYFKGPWTHQFNPGVTRPGPFTLTNGAIRTLPMMANTAVYGHYKGPAFEAISLPYASGKMAMYIVLPSAGNGLAGFQHGLTAGAWANLLPNLQPSLGTIVLPRFHVEYSAALNGALGALGMGVAFDPTRADLGGMVQLGGQRAYIGNALHKTVLKVDEQGTLAAAVTAIGVGATAMPMPAFTMTVNRPFFCAIRDESSSSVLFMGAIADPGQS